MELNEIYKINVFFFNINYMNYMLCLEVVSE